MQLQKFFAPFAGWYLTPKFRYYLYVWSSNPSQGDQAQVVGAGNLTYTFNRFVTFGAGITSLPAVRGTEGQFPYWLTVDNRLMADEFFRGSYTDGVWLKGDLPKKFKYMAMLADNSSVLGVSATQLDNTFNTQSYMVQWLPTTGEFGLYGTFGDFDNHQKVATRLGAHYTSSLEDKQGQPGANSIENSQIRLSDGSIVFTPDLFGPGRAASAAASSPYRRATSALPSSRRRSTCRQQHPRPASNHGHLDRPARQPERGAAAETGRDQRTVGAIPTRQRSEAGS